MIWFFLEDVESLIARRAHPPIFHQGNAKKLSDKSAPQSLVCFEFKPWNLPKN